MLYRYGRKALGKVFRAASWLVATGVSWLPDKTVLAVRAKTELLKKMDYRRHDVFLNIDSRIENDVRLFSCSKEPETVDWIESFFQEGDVFYDIGANVGAYSLVAAKFCGGSTKVYSFEPSFVNFPSLCKNINSNGCQDTIIPLQIALSNATEILTFNYHNLTPGGAIHALGEAVDYKGDAFVPVAQQPVLSYRLDDLISQFSIPAPTHLKIDVDGIELDILKGAKQTLTDPSVRSILIEIEESHDESEQIKEYIINCGLEFHSKHKYVHGGDTGPLSGIYNYIFHRPGPGTGNSATDTGRNMESASIGTN